jgi:hypothetical protein
MHGEYEHSLSKNKGLSDKPQKNKMVISAKLL